MAGMPRPMTSWMPSASSGSDECSRALIQVSQFVMRIAKRWQFLMANCVCVVEHCIENQTLGLILEGRCYGMACAFLRSG